MPPGVAGRAIGADTTGSGFGPVGPATTGAGGGGGGEEAKDGVVALDITGGCGTGRWVAKGGAVTERGAEIGVGAGRGLE